MRKFIISLLGVGLLIAATSYQLPAIFGSTAKTIVTQAPGSLGLNLGDSAGAEGLSQKLKEQSDSRVKEALVAIENAPKGYQTSEPIAGVVSEPVKNKLSIAYDFMRNSRNSLHRDHERKVILEQLAKDPSAVEAAAIYLMDNKLVNSHFGKHQSEARIFSIGLLREKAEQGDVGPLERTTRELAVALKENSNIPKGQGRDLEDLIASYFLVEKAHALNDLGAIVEKLGFCDALKQQFIAGIYFGLQSIHSKEEIIARLEQVGISPRGKG